MQMQWPKPYERTPDEIKLAAEAGKDAAHVLKLANELRGRIPTLHLGRLAARRLDSRLRETMHFARMALQASTDDWHTSGPLRITGEAGAL